MDMAQTIEEIILQAIEKDDEKAFKALMEKAQCGKYRLGRFPVLSLLYLYSSRALIAAYEKEFVKITVWEELHEPVRVVKQFSDKAGKCLRLYFGEVVSPLEMLLILDDTKRLKRLYPGVNPSKTVKSRLQSIYAVKYSLDVNYVDNEIVLDRRPLTRKERNKILSVCLGCFFAAAVVVAVPVGATAYVREHKFEVKYFRQIDFSSKSTYKLTGDITIPEGFSADEVNCNIVGGGHKIIFKEGASLGTLRGRISGADIRSSGSPLFTTCSSSAVLSDVTVNVEAEIQTRVSSAFVALTNYGTLENVTVNVGGEISALSGGSEDLIFAGLTVLNYNAVNNCTLNYSGLSLIGEAEANATFGGIVGINYSTVQGCAVTGKITSETFDLAGVCYLNYSEVLHTVNEADLTQTSADGWYPVVGGIAIDNVGIIAYCENAGDIAIDGQLQATCGGIAARTYWQSNYCISSGDITVSAPTAYVGGIFGVSNVATDIWGTYYFGYTNRCLAEGKISATLGDGASFVGGIGGYIVDHEIDSSKEVYVGGCVLNCIFIGEKDGDFDYFGNIVGVCGEHVYELNSYTSNGVAYPDFEGNLYAENGKRAFGAVQSVDGENFNYSQVADKGAQTESAQNIKTGGLYSDILSALGK